MASKALELQAWHAQMDMICDQYADAIAERDAFKARAITDPVEAKKIVDEAYGR